MTNNQRAFLDMIAHSEIGPALLAVSDNGYNVCVGSTAPQPILFSSYSAHPRIRCAALNSDAAGRYQLMGRYFAPYKAQLHLSDFGHDAQDLIALQQIKECRALGDIDAGRFDAAVAKCARIWASLPGAGYGQHENTLADLRAAYVVAGGTMA